MHETEDERGDTTREEKHEPFGDQNKDVVDFRHPNCKKVHDVFTVVKRKCELTWIHRGNINTHFSPPGAKEEVHGCVFLQPSVFRC